MGLKYFSSMRCHQRIARLTLGSVSMEISTLDLGIGIRFCLIIGCGASVRLTGLRGRYFAGQIEGVLLLVVFL